MIQPYNLTVRRCEDYRGEHREWDETVVISPAGVEAIVQHAIDSMGWDEIRAFQSALRGGQDYREDAGGFFLRAIGALLGLKGRTKDEIVTHQQALSALLKKAREK